MPLVALHLDGKLYDRVAEVVSSGNYKSVQHFLQVAAWNQVALEDSALSSEEGPRPRKAQAIPSRSPTRSPEAAPPIGSSTGRWALMVRRVEVAADDNLQTPQPLNEIGLALWGQTNRVLPIAVGVRVLANLMTQTQRPVAIADWHKRATRVATDLRKLLGQWDVAAGRRHGSLWATALPEDNPASAHRYVNQFLGVPRKDALPDGGAAFLGFVVFSGDDDEATVELTRNGAEWASLANPIFDRGDKEPSATFSVEETRYYLQYLRNFRAGEYRFLHSVAELVARGRSRTQIDDELATAYPAWSKYISTMRAGGLGRLSDLGLLDRVRHGLAVKYLLTPLAAEVGLAGPKNGAGS